MKNGSGSVDAESLYAGTIFLCKLDIRIPGALR